MSNVEAEMSNSVNVKVDVQVAKGPDGKHWVLLTVEDGLMSATVRMPPAAADHLAGGIAGNLTKAAVLARREDTGLVVAGQSGEL